MSLKEGENLREKPPRPLTSHERVIIARLVRSTGEVALVHVTETQLKKSIMDAHQRVRSLFARTHYHDYSTQGRGEAHREVRPFRLILDDRIVESKVSLYRPETKQGDPRLWPYGVNKFAEHDDLIALFVVDGVLHGLNISKSRFAEPNATQVVDEVALPRPSAIEYTMTTHEARRVREPAPSMSAAPVIDEILLYAESRSLAVANELLQRLRAISTAGPHPAVGGGDTAVGRTLETLLGIQANPRQAPDYRGIELKSGRVHASAARETRSTLFAQVPDWELSSLKSSREILQEFGYWRDSSFRLYCTVALEKPNSQGLFLRVGKAEAFVEERHRGAGGEDALVAVWRLATLHDRLLEKHAETFWIEARSFMRDGVEHFVFTRATHTRGPSVAMFDAQLSLGAVTMDHLIKGRGVTGLEGVKEKGPLWKVEKESVPLLFPAAPVTYVLG